MPVGIYAPLDVEGDIERSELLERLVVRNMLIAETYSDLAIQYTQSNPVFARECIEIAKRRAKHVDRLLSSSDSV